MLPEPCRRWRRKGRKVCVGEGGGKAGVGGGRKKRSVTPFTEGSRDISWLLKHPFKSINK